MIRLITRFSFPLDTPASSKPNPCNSVALFKFVNRVLLALVILPLYIVSPTLLAEPHQGPPTESVTITVPTESTENAVVNSSEEKKKGMHHPRGDLEGSYGFNTPARPGFWIAAGFTGLIIGLFFTTFLYFKPSKAQ